MDEIKRICGRAAVETQESGRHGSGAQLTPFGLSLIAHYRKVERSVEIAVRKELRADPGKHLGPQ